MDLLKSNPSDEFVQMEEYKNIPEFVEELTTKLEQNSNIKNTSKFRHRLMACVVCSKLCQYRYYNARCCESCKEFFRRTIILRKQWICRRENRCDSIGARIKCKSCRLDRCLLMGMDWRLVKVKAMKEGAIKKHDDHYWIGLQLRKEHLVLYEGK